MAKTTFRQADVKRALLAARDADMQVVETRIMPDGTILLRHVAARADADDALAEWRAKRAAQA